MNNEVLNHTQPDSFTVEKESEKDEIPNLKYQGQTPLNKPNNKRGCNVLSPAENALNDVDISQAIESGVQKASASLIPTIFQSILSEVRSTINEIVDDKLKQMKEEMQLRNVFENRKLESRYLKPKISKITTEEKTSKFWICRKTITADKGNLTSKQQRLSLI